jgi:hypothetical protein
MKILFIGDIVGRPGRETVKKLLPVIKQRENIDFIIANGENSAGGAGLNATVAGELFSYGVNVLTLGNHTWKRKEVSEIIDNENVLRPANYPPNVPGKGYKIYDCKGIKLAVVNLMGRVYMTNIDCPFRAADVIIEKLREEKVKLIIVDIHAEITSEKVSLGWYLDGKISALLGTHTHVQTADERILPQGTAYITDTGMTGSRDSVIGIKKEIIIKKYLTQLPFNFEVAEGDLCIAGVVVDIDEDTGRARSIKRVFEQASVVSLKYLDI